MTDLELLSLLRTLGDLHEVAFGEIVNGKETMMSAMEKLYSVHTFSFGEIKRLRAKVNRLIRVINEEDADEDHICKPMALVDDLSLEEETQ